MPSKVPYAMIWYGAAVFKIEKSGILRVNSVVIRSMKVYGEIVQRYDVYIVYVNAPKSPYTYMKLDCRNIIMPATYASVIHCPAHDKPLVQVTRFRVVRRVGLCF